MFDNPITKSYPQLLVLKLPLSYILSIHCFHKFSIFLYIAQFSVILFPKRMLYIQENLAVNISTFLTITIIRFKGSFTFGAVILVTISNDNGTLFNSLSTFAMGNDLNRSNVCMPRSFYCGRYWPQSIEILYFNKYKSFFFMWNFLFVKVVACCSEEFSKVVWHNKTTSLYFEATIPYSFFILVYNILA